MKRSDEWRPGSFTKNFSWGDPNEGFQQLHESICVGFGSETIEVSRETFRHRVASLRRPDYIAVNFFLYNILSPNGRETIALDELVFQAVNFRHSLRFDALAFFAFNLSLVGRWKGSKHYQKNPAQWAFHYVSDRLAQHHNWDTSKVSANDIQEFIASDPRYTGETSRKVATNYNYMYSLIQTRLFQEKDVSPWWVDAMFLALDRYLLDHPKNNNRKTVGDYEEFLDDVGFWKISGKLSTSKKLAARHFLRLYYCCDGLGRFSIQDTIVRTKDITGYLSNSDDQTNGIVLAVHPSNPHARKFIPRVCAILAKYAGFATIEIEDDNQFDLTKFVKSNTRQALKILSDFGAEPNMSAKELMKLLRDR